MKITVERFTSDKESTLSLILIDGRFSCFGLEDEHRAVKVANETRIPAGTYPVDVRHVGGVNDTYNQKFPGFHRGMLWLQDVPGFEWIYFHIGNTHQHTAGCILVGYGATATPDGMTLQASTPAYRMFYEKVIAAAERGELEVEIIDRDRS